MDEEKEDKREGGGKEEKGWLEDEEDAEAKKEKEEEEGRGVGRSKLAPHVIYKKGMCCRRFQEGGYVGELWHSEVRGRATN